MVLSEAGRYVANSDKITRVFTFPQEFDMSVQDQIRQTVTSSPVVLFMKGTPQFPQCGFSAAVAQVLKLSGVTDYVAVNVLADDEVRQGIKEYANWPTIPQLYIKGEFVGGSDIVKEMYASGELQKLLQSA